MLIDIHTHTYPYSDDSKLSLPDLIYHARKAGLDGICVTEHDWFWETGELEKIARDCNFPVIPGVELNTEEGHLLVFGLTKYIFGMHHARVVKEMVNGTGAIIVAHPYRRHFKADEEEDESGYYPSTVRVCEQPIFEMADAVEILNGRAKPEENIFSRQVAKRLRMKECAGSDAHLPEDLGRCATYFEKDIRNLQDFITEIKFGRFRPVTFRNRSGSTPQ